MIKPTLKNLKQTHHGKKIYEKLMSNYSEHLGQSASVVNKVNLKNSSFSKK
jgi:hypothetical protein